jgi:Flp pilus assembly protein TadG
MKRANTRLQAGQELAEYALTLTIFLMIIFVILDLGRAVYAYSALHNAAREGARYGAVHPGDYSGISNAVDRLAVGIEVNPPSIVVYEDALKIKNIKVCIATQFAAATPFVGTLLGSNEISLRSCSTMQVED